MSNKKYVTVTALTKYIKRKFDVDPHLGDIWIKGELSNVKIHTRGHIYFTLKDKGARIQAVMFQTYNRQLKFRPEDGMNVFVRGEISVYEPSGTYQVYVKEIEPDGVGSLYLAYEELKRNLEKEGLFDQKYKKPIPKYPSYVGVITSPTGAAIRDILTTIRRRYPLCKVVLLPALVQGVEASSSIAKQIRKANELGYLDVLIVGRGGGSIEELWAFNEEVVAREIFQSSIPIISAVGHETDYTISDFVSDLRAPTPTGAAELAVPDVRELKERIQQRKLRLMKELKDRIKYETRRLDDIKKSYAFKYPKQLYHQKEQQLDLMMSRFDREVRRYIKLKKDAHRTIHNRLLNQHPYDQVTRAKEKHQEINKKLVREMKFVLELYQSKLKHQLSKLDALSPLKVMERGYSVVYHGDKLIKSVNQVKKSDKINVEMQDGHVKCEVIGIEER